MKHGIQKGGSYLKRDCSVAYLKACLGKSISMLVNFSFEVYYTSMLRLKSDKDGN